MSPSRPFTCDTNGSELILHSPRGCIVLLHERFQREHEIERQKNLTSQTANLHLSHHPRYAHTPFDQSAEPEGDPVRDLSLAYSSHPDEPQNVVDWDRYTIVGTCTELFKDYLRLTSVRASFLHATFKQSVRRNRNRSRFARYPSYSKLLSKSRYVSATEHHTTGSVTS